MRGAKGLGHHGAIDGGHSDIHGRLLAALAADIIEVTACVAVLVVGAVSASGLCTLFSPTSMVLLVPSRISAVFTFTCPRCSMSLPPAGREPPPLPVGGGSGVMLRV
jgi:hypothetical protein